MYKFKKYKRIVIDETLAQKRKWYIKNVQPFYFNLKSIHLGQKICYKYKDIF